MAISDLNTFLHDFFTAHHCKVVHNQQGVLAIQLTEEMDRALMNRPFYWHYIKKMGKLGEPMQLVLKTDPRQTEMKGELIHFGSPRLQQILNHLKHNERYTKLFEKITTTINTPLYPWLVVNIKISYIGKQKREELFSIGLNLVNGKMVTEMMDQLQKKEWEISISDYCYTISPLIKIGSGYLRIERVLVDYIKKQELDWAQQSLLEYEKEMNLLEHFYTDKSEEEAASMQKEKDEISSRFLPKIVMSVVNGGIFYANENL